MNQLSDDLPWISVASFVPKGFRLEVSGVFVDKQDPELVAGPCWITAYTRSKQGFEWGFVIHWLDQDGNSQMCAFPAQRLHERGAPLASELAGRGLRVIPGKQGLLMRYLASFDLPQDFRRQSVSSLGWLDCAEDEAPVFVLPEKTLGLRVREEVIFQPEEHSPTLRTMHAKGTLRQWQQFVGKKCLGHPILMFGLSAAFAGPLLKLVGEECGGFHFFGSSSKGKTTTLQVAASVWGCAADPAANGDSHISRWNTTGNALEATAAAHNDGLLCLDEMGTCDQRNFGKVIYDLMGGTGKRRLNKNAMMQSSRTWRIVALSTGEISVRQKIEEDGGSPAKTGQLIRLVDVPIHDGVLDPTCPNPQAVINDLKKNCGKFYGSAGPEFLDQLVSFGTNFREIRQQIQQLLENIEEAIAVPGTLETFQQRVMRRIAVVAAAGILAAELKILPFTRQDVLAGAVYVAKQWFGDVTNLPPQILGVLAIREFITANEARFRPAGEDRAVRDQVGFTTYTVESGKKLFLLTRTGLYEACRGYDVRSVLRELKQSKFLFIQEAGKMTSKHTIKGSGRQSLYAIREAILDFDGYNS